MFTSPSARSRAVLFRLGAILAATVSPAALMAAEPSVQYDEISVTATRDARPTKDVPLAISVIGKDRIDDEKMMNFKEAVQGTAGVQIDSNSGGYDVRLMIRGAGVNAQYGVREIMVLRDGVPVTDPNSFTTFDWIDPQDIERIEVVKGPGSVFATGSAGGTIQILSKSVFDDSANVVRVGLGNFNTQNYHVRAGGKIDENQALAINLTRRYQDPSWRQQSRFEDNQGSLKYGRIDDGGGTLESEISFSNARLSLPGTMNQAQFDQYRGSGKQPGRADAFLTSERDSQTQTANLRYERDLGDFTIKPRAYFTHWSQFHPVTGIINKSDKNYVFGTDLEADAKHDLFGLKANLVTGISLRGDLYLDARKYQYQDVKKGGSRITATLSDALGPLIETDNTQNYLAGLFLEENIGLTDRLNLDVGGRADVSFLALEQQQSMLYNYSTGAYTTTNAANKYAQPTYNLYSPKAGLSYKLTPETTTYASTAMADQVPAGSQILTNFGLTPSHATNYELGVKHRSKDWNIDAATYYSLIRNDIVSAVSSGQTVYQNAGQTEKKGIELGAAYQVLDGLHLGGTYTFTDYHYLKFSETSGTRTLSRDGNRVPSIPINMYSLFAEYKSDFGLRSRVQTMTVGDYRMDNASTLKYGGYSFVTNAMVGYEFDRHSISLNVENLFNQHYSVDAKKDSSGNLTYAPAAPFSFLVSYAMKY